MHPYIPHLLEDILAAYYSEEIQKMRFNSLHDIPEIVNRLEQAHSFGYWCGLKPENFPPSEQLLAKETKIVNTALRKMMKSWKVGCSLPKNLPPKIAYSILIRCLDRNFDPAIGASVVWGFCSLNPEDCALGKYCTNCNSSNNTDKSSTGQFIELRFKEE